MTLNQFGIKDVVSNRVHVTSYSEKLIKMIFESGFKTKWNRYEVVRL